jgi:hypothetical protein
MIPRLFLAPAAAALTACGGAARPTPAAPIGARPPPPPAGPPAPTAPASPRPSGDTVGTAHPLVLEAAARDGAWIAICQARADTDGDGAIAVHAGMHGDTWGDRLVPYLVRGVGEGEAIDSLVGYTQDGRWVIALRAGMLALLDVQAWRWTELPGADVRDDGVPLGPHRAASVAGRGARMTYLRDDETIVIRELATDGERVVKVAGARVWRVEVEPTGELALVYALRNDTDGDGTLTWPSVRTSLSDRDCRGPIMSYSTGGWGGDRPDELWLELATGALTSARPGPPAAEEPDLPPLGEVDGRAVIAVDGAGRKLLAPSDEGRDIPSGPLTWTR